MSQEPQNINVNEVFYRNTPPNILSESPIYRASDSTLHWLDLLSQPGSNVYILPLDPITSKPLGESRVLPVYLKRNGVDVGVEITYIGFRKGNRGYICAYGQGIGYLDEESGMVDIIEQFIEDGDKEGWSMNDGGIDPQGRLWINEVDLVTLGRGMSPGGSFVGARGRLWRYDGERCTVMERGLTGGNGMGWSPCGRFMYVNDSGPNVLWRYDFDGETGEISNKTKIFDGLQGPKGIVNDGMVVDQEGNLWIAMWMGHSVAVYSPQGEVLKKITFPAKCVTCPTWGGKENEMLFVVSGQTWPLEEQSPLGDEGGHVFLYKAGIKGMVKNEFVGSV